MVADNVLLKQEFEIENFTATCAREATTIVNILFVGEKGLIRSEDSPAVGKVAPVLVLLFLLSGNFDETSSPLSDGNFS